MPAKGTVNNPVISIVIPTYNAAGTIRACIDSIISQDYQHFEVWIVDGLSTDDTLKVIKDYQATYPYIKLVSEKDKGIYDAMNKGIELCTGQWVYFLGSDDTLYNNEVLSVVANVAKTTNVGVIYGNVIMRGQNQWNLDNVVFNGEYDLPKLLELTINHQAMFYNRQVFDKCGVYDLTYKTNADYDFNLRCYATTKFQYVNIIVANFFVGGQSTQHPDNRFEKDRGALFLKYFGRGIFGKSFVNSRLYLQRAALSADSPLNVFKRAICALAYAKLKLQSTIQ